MPDGHAPTTHPTAICPVEGSHAVIVDGWCSVCGATVTGQP